MKVCLYGQKYKEEHSNYLGVLLEKLKSLKAEMFMFDDYAKQINSTLPNKFIKSNLHNTFISNADLQTIDPDLMITLGGDGTILGATSIIKDIDLPILGINLGRLGFLAGIEKNKIELALDSWISGNYRIEDRIMIGIKSSIPIFSDYSYALNDFTLLKRDTSSMVKIHSYINGQFLNSYWADGLIVCTPTGSTGYSLSCGGPIIFPNSGNFAITPVAPHNLNVRPIVIPDDSVISFKIEGRSENFLCTLDSRFETVSAEHEIEVFKAPTTTKLVFLEDIDFMNTIRQKLSWGFDKRNI